MQLEIEYLLKFVNSYKRSNSSKSWTVVTSYKI